MRYSVEPDKASFERVILALESESDGKKLEAELVQNLRDILEPAVAEAKSAVMAVSSGGIPHAGTPLGSAVAAGVDTYVRLGKNPMVGIEAKNTGMPRGFKNAPKRLDSRKGWRHPVFGTDKWVLQMGAPGWFEDAITKRQDKYRKAVEQALQHVADRIARKA